MIQEQGLRTNIAATLRLLRSFLPNRGVGSDGIAATEFAMFAPMLVLAMIGVADLGMGVYRKMQVQNAAQAGAAYAMVNGFNASSITSSVLNATSFGGISAEPAPTWACGCPSATGTTGASCNSTCADGTVAGVYVTVSAQGTYNTLVPYPGLTNSFNFISQSTVRIQ
jgi:Flp pilus assembly protein TadG